MSVAVSKNAVMKSVQSIKGEHVRSRSSSPARPPQALSPPCPSSPAKDNAGFGILRRGRGTPSPDPVRESPSSSFRTEDAHADTFISRLHSTTSPPRHSHHPAPDPTHHTSILAAAPPLRSASVSSTLCRHTSHPAPAPEQVTLLAAQFRTSSSPGFPTPSTPKLQPLHPTPAADAAQETESETTTTTTSLLEDAPAPPPPSSHPLGATHKHLLKLLTRAGADSLKVAQLLQSPLDGLANIAADSGSELLLKRVAAASTAAGPGPAAGNAAGGIQYNPVHARVLSVLLSALLSSASAQSAGVELLPGLPPALQPGGGTELARGLAAEAGRLAPVAAMAPAPALKAGDAEDAIGASTLAASAGLRALVRAGSDAKKALPDLSNILDGVLGSVHDSIDEGDAPIPSAQLLQQHFGLSRQGGAGSDSGHGAGVARA